MLSAMCQHVCVLVARGTWRGQRLSRVRNPPHPADSHALGQLGDLLNHHQFVEPRHAPGPHAASRPKLNQSTTTTEVSSWDENSGGSGHTPTVATVGR